MFSAGLSHPRTAFEKVLEALRLKLSSRSLAHSRSHSTTRTYLAFLNFVYDILKTFLRIDEYYHANTMTTTTTTMGMTTTTTQATSMTTTSMTLHSSIMS